MGDLIGRLVDRGRGDPGGLRPRIDPMLKIPPRAVSAEVDPSEEIEALSPRRLFSPQPEEATGAERWAGKAGQPDPDDEPPSVEPASSAPSGLETGSRSVDEERPGRGRFRLFGKIQGEPGSPHIDPTAPRPTSRAQSSAPRFTDLGVDPPSPRASRTNVDRVAPGGSSEATIAPPDLVESNRGRPGEPTDRATDPRAALTPRREAGESRGFREAEDAPSAADASPAVQIRIGRIEVRAVVERAVPPPALRRPAPALSLDAYLRARSRGDR